MKINIFEKAHTPAPELLLRLVPSIAYENSVDLCVVTPEGKQRPCGRILTICEGGLYRAVYMSSELGVATGKEGRVALLIDTDVKERLDRLGRVLEGKESHTTLLSNGAEVVRISDIRAILDYLR